MVRVSRQIVVHVGVLHPLILWVPIGEEKYRYFDLAPEWIQKQWSEIHGAPITKLRRYRAGRESESRMSNYIVTQYLIQQQKAGGEDDAETKDPGAGGRAGSDL